MQRKSIIEKKAKPVPNAYDPVKGGGRILMIFSDGAREDIIRQVAQANKDYCDPEDGQYLPRMSNVARMFLALAGKQRPP